MPGSAVTIDHIRAAAGRIAPYVHRTPVLSSRLINAEAGGEIAQVDPRDVADVLLAERVER